ncbi:hypothetical protein LPJ72_004029 [Coemansia sp. Benny D160-2]|nr:hypothetical protein LPJ72_004029 [Coemansia sp. Benny D160-2]
MNSISRSSSGSEQFILRVVIEYLLAPGYTGELAREALVLIVQVLLLAPESRDRQVAVLLDQARVAEMLVEHMSYLYSQVPVFRPMPRSPTARLFGSDYRGNRRLAPLDRRRRRHPAQATSSSSSCRRIRPEHPSPSDAGAAETQPAHRYYDDVKPRLQALLARESVLRSVADQDRRELDILKSARVGLEHVDAFFLTWELIDEIAAISNGSEPRITTAVQRQLSNGFLRTHIVPALMAQMTSMSQAITTVSYLTDLVNATHSTAVLDALFAVLLGTDLSPETQTQNQQQNQLQLQIQLQLQHPAEEAAADAPGEGGGDDAMDVTESELSVLSTEDRALLASIEDDTLRAEAAALLLPPGSDVSRILGSAAAGSSGSTVAANGPANSRSGSADEGAERRAASEPHASLRATLIGWMTLEDNMHLSLSTMRLFDAILASMNQLAYTSLVLRNFAEGEEEEQDESESQTQRGFYSGPALGLGKSVAADQELVRAVVERFLDATPGNICNALPEAVVAAAMRIDKSPSSSAEMQPAPPLLLQSQMQSVPLVREYQGCDEYVADILQRLRFNQEYLGACWLSKRQFIRQQQQQQQQHSIGIGASAAAAATPAHASIDEAHAMTAALFYPGAFVRSLVDQFAMAVKRHMAYNLLLTSMASKLVAIADPALSAYLFLANSATVRPPTSPSQPPCALLYDSFVRASADAYVKSERIPRFAARLARQRREGVENAIKVGAAHPQARVSLAAASSSADVLRRSGAPGGDSGIGSNGSSSSRAHEDTARAAEFLGTPIKRFVHGYIVLDEFGKEMAAAAMALHTLELERAMDRLVSQRAAPAVAADDDYADILDYFDPEEPAYKRALAVQQTLRTSSRAIIDLGGRSQMGRGSNNSVGSG